MNFFFQPELTHSQSQVILSPEESRHVAKVLRGRPGDKARILNGAGLLAEAVIKETDPGRCILEIVKILEQAERKSLVHIALANLKNRDRLEWFVEKAVELGAGRISIYSSQRTEKHGLDAKRLERIAVSALKQSGNLWLPAIETGIKYKDLLNNNGQLFIAHCSEKLPAAPLQNAVTGSDCTILIGPEGDFTDEEIRLALEAGAVPVSLGPLRLRSETAALAALIMAQQGCRTQ